MIHADLTISRLSDCCRSLLSLVFGDSVQGQNGTVNVCVCVCVCVCLYRDRLRQQCLNHRATESAGRPVDQSINQSIVSNYGIALHCTASSMTMVSTSMDTLGT